MSSTKPTLSLVRVNTDLVRSEKPARTVELGPEDTIPRRPVEVMTDEQKRQQEQAERKVDLPEDFFKTAPRFDPPLAPGVEVNIESLLGFLEAMESILPPESNYPILSSAKLWHLPDGGDPRLFLEAGSHAVWTAVALRVTAEAAKGFSALMPVRRAKNVLKMLRDHQPSVVIGVDEQGVTIGPRTVPFGGLLDDMAEQPIVKDAIARAAVPAPYFREICSRVLVARSTDFKELALQGALFDFDDLETGRPQCTVVATDGLRVHLLRLSQMKIEMLTPRLRALPPTCTVAAGFFHYIKEVIQHEWTVLEFAPDQVVARGSDFLVVAKAPAEGKSTMRELSDWRRYDVEWGGHWAVPREKLEQVLAAAALEGTADLCNLQLDRSGDRLRVASRNDAGDAFVDVVPAKSFGGATVVDVWVSLPHLREAISVCVGNLIRLSFDRNISTQSASPVVVQGEDDNFKAVLLPRK